MKKEVVYLRQTAGQGPKEIEAEKIRLSRLGYLVVTFIEGKGEMAGGLYELLKSHYIHNLAKSS